MASKQSTRQLNRITENDLLSFLRDIYFDSAEQTQALKELAKAYTLIIEKINNYIPNKEEAIVHRNSVIKLYEELKEDLTDIQDYVKTNSNITHETKNIVEKYYELVEQLQSSATTNLNFHQKLIEKSQEFEQKIQENAQNFEQKIKEKTQEFMEKESEYKQKIQLNKIQIKNKLISQIIAYILGGSGILLFLLDRLFNLL